MNHWTNHADDPAAATTTDPATAAAATTSTTASDPASLLQQGQGNDWLPEKYRTLKEGTQDIDIEASARKLADAHKSLESRIGQSGLLPKTPEEYKVEGLGEGVNFEEVKKDPMFQDVLKKAHAAGISNESVQFFMQTYFKDIAPQLFQANAQLTRDEAAAELKGVWKDDATMTKNLGLANRAVTGFALQGDATGSAARLMEKYGNDPDFLAFAAAVGSEMQEDTPIAEGSQAANDWDAQVAAIRANPAYSDAAHPQHKGLQDQMTALYQKRFGNKAVQLGGATIR